MTQFILTLQKTDTSSNTHPNVVNQTTNSHVNIGSKEIELLIIAKTPKQKVRQRWRFYGGQRLLRRSHNDE